MEKADLIFYNATVYYPVDGAMAARPAAVAITGNEILAVGPETDILRHRGLRTEVVNLHGGLVLPGLHDAHAHLLSLGRLLEEVNLIGTHSAQEAVERVRDHAATLPEEAWITGRGWNEALWDPSRYPSALDLADFEGRPVYLRRVDGHAAWVNRTALALAGITSATTDPAGGRILRDRAGNPTGILIDNAADLVANLVPEPTFEDQRRRALAAFDACTRAGLTAVTDAGFDSMTCAVFQDLAEQGELPIRVYAMIDGHDTSLTRTWFERGPLGAPGDRLVIRAVKLYADGALGSRGAAMLEPYSDDRTTTGLMVHTREELVQAVSAAGSAGFQVCTHAIGDRANRIMLDIYDEVMNRQQLTSPRWRIEHAQVVHLEDIPRFAALGVIPSMQPTHATSDMVFAEARLGRERLQGAYAWRLFLDAGCRIPCGSDFPVESHDPRYGLWAAVTRENTEGSPAGGWIPGQRMTLHEAAGGFTLDAAWASFAESVTGSIEPGKRADVTIIDRNIFHEDYSALLQYEVLFTLVDGQIVYRKE